MKGKEERRYRRRGKEIIGAVAATNKELQFDWITHSPNDRHSTRSFCSLVDGICEKLSEYLLYLTSDFWRINRNVGFVFDAAFRLSILMTDFHGFCQ